MKNMYEDRKEFVEMLETAKRTPIEYKNYRGSTQEWNDVGKFIDEYYDKVLIEDMKSEEYLMTEEEIKSLRNAAKAVFNKAARYVYGRDCKFADNMDIYPEVHADRVGHLLEEAIRKLTNEIEPHIGQYLTPTYSSEGRDKGTHKVRRAVKEINVDIELLKSNIRWENSGVQSIGYEHHSRTEAGMSYTNEELVAKHEAFAECDRKIKTAQNRIKKLEGFKEKIGYSVQAKEDKEEKEAEEANDLSRKGIRKKRLKQKAERLLVKRANVEELTADEINKLDKKIIKTFKKVGKTEWKGIKEKIREKD